MTMLRDKTFFLVLATLIVAGIAAGPFHHQDREVQPALRGDGPQARSQSGPTRVWRERSFVRTLSLSPGAGAPLSRPLSLKEDRSGDLLVLDWSAGGVRRFSPTGKPGTFYRLPAGTPAANPDDFDADTGGNLWICYQDTGSMAELDAAGKPLQSWRLASRPHRVLAPGQGRLVVLAGATGPDLFDRYSAQGELLGGFGRLLAGDVQDPLALDGDVARDGDGFIYAATHAGLLAAYTFDGGLRFLARTIDPIELPKILVSPSGERRVAPGSPLAAIAVSVSGGMIYVLVDAPAPGGPSRALDVYADRDGRYLYSFHAPEQASFALVAGDRLYTIHGDEVTRWRM
jgi:hypothetical protein